MLKNKEHESFYFQGKTRVSLSFILKILSVKVKVKV